MGQMQLVRTLMMTSFALQAVSAKNGRASAASRARLRTSGNT